MSDPFLGEMKVMAFDYPPKGWAQCDGQTLPINQNQALYSLLSTTYGGDGRTNFALPDMRGRVPVGMGALALGASGGEEQHTLTLAELPTHTHQLSADAWSPGASNLPSPLPEGNSALGQSQGQQTPGGPFSLSIYGSAGAGGSLAPQAVAPVGQSQPHENRQPYLTLNVCIAVIGTFPSPN